MRRSVSLFLSCKINQRGRPIITVSKWWFASQKDATLLPRNVPRTVRVRPTKQGNGNPTKGGLSLSLHSTMAQCYLFDVLPPCCVFPILPETFFLSPLAPISSIRFNPSLPFSPLSPSSLDTCNNRCKSRGPLESSTEDPCEAFGRHMFSGRGGCFIELRTLGSSMITRITMEKKRTENIFKRIFCRFSPIFFPINEYLTICLKIFEFSIKFEEISSRARSRRTKKGDKFLQRFMVQQYWYKSRLFFIGRNKRRLPLKLAQTFQQTRCCTA